MSSVIEVQKKIIGGQQSEAHYPLDCRTVVKKKAAIESADQNKKSGPLPRASLQSGKVRRSGING
jgi:hypothetical protein